MDLFIELKNDCTSFRQDIYSEVDGFPKLMCPTITNNQSDEPLPPIARSLQHEIFEAELKSKVSTHASVAQSTSAIPEVGNQVLKPILKNLGLIFDKNLSFMPHLNAIQSKVEKLQEEV
ncbi:hypothetical protein AVEN_28467-1 [Araneus ventricosus]|uniref:Uncharacterized protein n=1 Tax=Araneus ventricosus TaxID=182803 RepID=A0A4Y2N1H4_ARAVE|nr:hypothetical protein AVEN_28467-1 [Araneus ventricosus]